MERRRKNICVDVGETVHRKAKAYAASQGITLKALVAKCLERESIETQLKSHEEGGRQ